MKLELEWNLAIALYDLRQASTNIPLPFSNFSISRWELVKALVTRMPEMLLSREALITALPARRSVNASRILRL